MSLVPKTAAARLVYEPFASQIQDLWLCVIAFSNRFYLLYHRHTNKSSFSAWHEFCSWRIESQQGRFLLFQPNTKEEVTFPPRPHPPSHYTLVQSCCVWPLLQKQELLCIYVSVLNKASPNRGFRPLAIIHSWWQRQKIYVGEIDQRVWIKMATSSHWCLWKAVFKLSYWACEGKLTVIVHRSLYPHRLFVHKHLISSKFKCKSTLLLTKCVSWPCWCTLKVL